MAFLADVMSSQTGGTRGAIGAVHLVRRTRGRSTLRGSSVQAFDMRILVRTQTLAWSKVATVANLTTLTGDFIMAGHGSKPLRGLTSTGQSSTGIAKFGRMFRWLPPCFVTSGPKDEQEVAKVLESLATLMIATEFKDKVEKATPLQLKNRNFTADTPLTIAEPDDESPKIPAGYTYLGQFIDHDTTFDPASSLQQQNDPDALEDFRTPRLDLDSVYGRGPDDQPYLYLKDKDKVADRKKFVLGTNRGINGMQRPDLQRTDDGTALIGDKRNDENKIVAQIQALFLRFHNKVFDNLESRFNTEQQEERFLEAQRIVRWCYQWIVLRDFLPRVCSKVVVDEIMPTAKRRTPSFQFYAPHGGDAYIPVEFSVAAYRFGHSMVRPSYALNGTAESTAVFTTGNKSAKFSRIPIFVFKAEKSTDAMNGFGEFPRQLPDSWGIDWAFYFGELGLHKDGKPQIPQPSYRIDATLVDPLGALPEFVSKGAASPFISLAFRNLMRGHSMGLPSGQRVAQMMGAKVLSEKELWATKNIREKLKPWNDGLAKFYEANGGANKKWVKGAAPLWYYILKEAEVRTHGHHLGEVGSRIVAETLIGLVWFDHFSYLFQMPHWTPAEENLPGLGNKLDMLELTKFVG